MDIIPAYEHTRYGNVMFNICAAFTKFAVKHKFVYYLLACTWGIIMTLLSIIVTIVLGIGAVNGLNIKFKKYNFIYGVSCGPDYWGGFETGLMYVRDLKSTNQIDAHEFGHTFQNCVFGPFVLFVSFIPSMLRYWYQVINSKKGKQNKPYDSMWFEDAATQCGLYANWYLNNKTV